MNRRGELDVIVVGAGAIGAALALAFARDGFDVALVEAREPKPWRGEDEVDLRVVALAADARGLLSDLDVWPSIQEARSSAYRRMRVWDAQSPGELDFDAADDGEAALGWIVENKLIQHALWQALHAGAFASTNAAPAEPRRWGRGSANLASAGRAAGPGNVRVYCPAEVADIDDAADAVTATLDDGSRLRARLLVVAEGAESSLRERLGIAFRGRDYGQRAVVAHVATERPHESTAWQRFRPGGPLAFLPLADGRCSIVWSLPDAEAARVLALDDASFRAELGCAFDFRLGAITQATPRAAFPLRMRLAERYLSGRCVLAGDAAHLVHPLAGQGMNLGFRDVRALRSVARAARERGSDIGGAHVLRRYERERRSENALAARGLDAIERVFGSPHLPWLRGFGLSFASRFEPVRALLVDVAAGRR
jgi:2-octaprenyl-3-methyl-6-methoxy-1,4-benzoquinol hydroxylase/2-octaprenylphenol hydroxylase